MSESEIIDELVFNSKWLSPEYKQSHEYKDYLIQVGLDLGRLIKATILTQY
jgi:hypothetical protein